MQVAHAFNVAVIAPRDEPFAFDLRMVLRRSMLFTGRLITRSDDGYFGMSVTPPPGSSANRRISGLLTSGQNASASLFSEIAKQQPFGFRDEHASRAMFPMSLGWSRTDSAAPR
jgi:hypothetical protein